MKLCQKCGEENLNFTTICNRCYAYLDSKKSETAHQAEQENRFRHYRFEKDTCEYPSTGGFLNSQIGHMLVNFKVKMNKR